MNDKLTKLRREFMVIGHCGMVDERKTLREMLELIKTPKGVEHCTEYNLPTLDIIRELRDTEEVKASEWIIDKKGVELHDPKWVILAGDSEAVITCETNKYPCHIVLLHGAKAHIIARGHSVVIVDRSKDSKADAEKSDRAFVML